MTKVGNAPCSWGVLEFDLEREPLDYKVFLDELSSIGYTLTELGDYGFMSTLSHVLKDELDKRKLELTGAFIPVNFSVKGAFLLEKNSINKVADLVSNVNQAAYIVLSDDNCRNDYRKNNAGRISENDSLSDSEWEIFTTQVNETAKYIWKKFGLRSVFHHHCGGFVETPNEVKKLMDNTNPDLLGICLDTGHYQFGGGDPVKFLEENYDRIWYVHFKDFSKEIAKKAAMENWDYFESVRNGVFCELGTGDVNFKEIAQILKEKNYSGWIIVEQDVLPGMGEPKECAERNFNYIKELGII